MHALHQREHVYKFNQSFEKIHFFLGIDENSPCESYHRAVKKNRKMEKKKTITSTLENYYLHCMKNFRTILHEIEIKILSNSSKEKKKNQKFTSHEASSHYRFRGSIHPWNCAHRTWPRSESLCPIHRCESGARTIEPRNDDATISTDRLISRFARLYSPGKSTLLV